MGEEVGGVETMTATVADVNPTKGGQGLRVTMDPQEGNDFFLFDLAERKEVEAEVHASHRDGQPRTWSFIRKKRTDRPDKPPYKHLVGVES